ncbi:serine protein kinase RIO [bacterium]|nr:serine protein kinase RIO [bacterium]
MPDERKLEALLEEGAIDEVLGQLQSGKEASLYLVRRQGELIAAKVYKERDRRSFKNNAVYAEGRKIQNTRDLRALARRSRHGKATQEAAWKTAESETLRALHAAHVRVPRPIAFHEGVVLMELIRDAKGEAAPRLVDTRPSPEDALRIHEVLMGEIVKMLLSGWIHGDLSAYNVLMGAGGPVLIDFPQSVSASHNSQARELLSRDVRNVTDFLAGFEPKLSRHRSAGAEIWGRYERGELDPDWTGAPADPTTRPSSLRAEGDPADELARQIAEATSLPHGVARARGRRISREGDPPPARAPERPASKAPGPPAETKAPAAGLWDYLADRYGHGSG